ncbi:hypothetical protein N7474_003512 [Penicillium riverlandense]|uniref:uncharacterized protein n=1 Tax=Penicillium riverlandense TaxID=1903569 RepID=UPI0025499E22|nr:uncharacterized protein N7474_003512 [Penicillium riverlandense]KAJ5826374.1 hypothetical protein N7474_003512 [Penicillium riverlandense]
MAPSYPRQIIHSLTPTPHLPKDPPTSWGPKSKRASAVVFGELFAVTFAIFVVAVLLWKIGQFIRSFNKHKVLREGKPPTARYARTWYGWVSLNTHKRNKRVFHRCFARLREWTAWKSTRADYRWVWWDPDRKEMERRRRERRFLEWLPEWFQSYDYSPADGFCSSQPLSTCHGARRNRNAILGSSIVARSLRGLHLANSSRDLRSSHTVPQGERLASLSQEVFSAPAVSGDCTFDEDKQCHFSCPRAVATKARPFTDNTTLFQYPRPSFRNMALWASSHEYRSSGQPRQLFAQSNILQPSPPDGYRQTWRKSQQDKQPLQLSPPSQHRHLRKYRVWSARMQMQTGSPRRNWDGPSGPPGTPITELLPSCTTDRTVASRASGPVQRKECSGYQWESYDKVFRTIEDMLIRRHMRLLAIDPAGSETMKWNSAPARFRLSKGPLSGVAMSVEHQEWQPMRPSKRDADSHVISEMMRDNLPYNSKVSKRPRALPTPERKECKEDLCDWEVRMMHRLDRKLVWLFNELTPGQKPYHFAILANHWLNRETWLVTDPVSRVPIDARREWGDPRFNVPYPNPTFSPKPKYPVIPRKQTRIPRIESWRVAVNQQRKTAGIREAIRTVGLYEESADEPPDGHIDPACWILRKPPQGFEISTRQKTAWYEGGVGWQEKLDDWQHVRHGYLMHKLIHGGRVNRTWFKEVAAQINKPLQLIQGKGPVHQVNQEIC